jgi:hypothetical protein
MALSGNSIWLSLSTIIAVAFSSLSGAQANTFTFDWSLNIGGVQGSGTMTGAFAGSNSYTITGLSGTFNGSTITGLIGVGGYFGNDNTLYYPASLQVDQDGISFNVEVEELTKSGPENEVEDVNLFDGFGSGPWLEYTVDGSIYLVGPGAFSASPTPLPGTLPLFATGLGGLGLLNWRRKGKARAVAA